MLRSVLAALALVAAADAAAQTHTGSLRPGDETLNSGEYVDEYVVEARQGETVRAVLTSDEFDTYVILVSATGGQAEDDDCTEGETTRSCAEWTADADGSVRVLVTTFQPGETGQYRVEVSVGTDSGPAAQDGRR